jgi:hypothetical protein
MKRRCRFTEYTDLDYGEAPLHSSTVSAKHRGKNIYPAMLAAVCKRLSAVAKFSAILGHIEVDNVATSRGILRVGFAHVGRDTYVLCLGRLIFKPLRYGPMTPGALGRGTNGEC